MPRPRISILTALLLMTILGMSIVIARLWREVGPQRAELLTRRNEMGQLFITDPQKAHAIGVDSKDSETWRWRVYLPKRPRRANDWFIYTYVGQQPAWPDGVDEQAWLAEPRKIKGSMSGMPTGEFTLDIKLEKDDEGWYLQHGDGWIKRRIPKSFNAWLDDPNGRFWVSKVLHDKQTVYKPGEPIILMCLQRGSEATHGGYDGDSIIIWIEERPWVPKAK